MAYNKDVRISEKLILTQQEAAAYAGIGIHRLEAMIRNNPQADFIIRKGKHISIKRQAFEDFIKSATELEQKGELLWINQ